MKKKEIFSKIIRKEIPSNILYQDELVTAFCDSFPKAPVHVLIVPNILIPTLNEINQSHEIILGRMTIVAVNVAKKKGIAEKGYRIIMNCNSHGGQEIYHIHMHLLGGKPLGSI